MPLRIITIVVLFSMCQSDICTIYLDDMTCYIELSIFVYRSLSYFAPHRRFGKLTLSICDARVGRFICVMAESRSKQIHITRDFSPRKVQDECILQLNLYALRNSDLFH